ncbi:hypothetical protein bcgnr5372_37740 [Bacillus luti]|nr:hypothetical protein [Bacillus cereus]HDR8329462.1 hypothetical protein [Bacillus cereus]HDR8338171.1 hypothetical protein [Bacillus cereus]
MKKGIIILIGIIIASVAAYFVFQSKEQPANTAPKETKTKQLEGLEKLETPIRPGIEPDHIWKFTLEKKIDKNTIQNKVYILNEVQQKVPANIEVNNEEITIKPPQDGYGKDKTYELFVDKDIKYVDGKNIEPIHFTFITKRDEVAKATFRKDLIKIKKEQIDKVEEDSIILKDSELKGKLKKDSIIVLETGSKEIPEIARKVSSVKEDGRKIIIDTITPKFEELFDDLDLYTNIRVTPEDIKVEPINGLTFSNINTGLTASAAPNMFLAEEKKGFFNFNKTKFIVDEYEVTVDGNMKFRDGDILPDVVVKNKSIKRFHLYMEQIVDTELNVSVKNGKGEKKFKKGLETGKSFPIGNFKVPSPIPFVFVDGKIYLKIEITASGEAKVSIEYTVEERLGIKSNNGKVQAYDDVDVDLKDVQFTGEGKVGVEAGPGTGVSLSAMQVFSVGLDANIGGYAEATMVLPVSNIENTCAKSEAGLYAKGEANIKAFPTLGSIWKTWGGLTGDLKYKYEVIQTFIDEKSKIKEWDSCKVAKDLLFDPKEVLLKPGEEKEINISLNMLDKEASKEEAKSLGEEDKKFLSVRTKHKDVVEAEVTNSGKIKLIANETPSQQNTEVEVVYDNEDKGIKKSIAIPVKITDFNPMSLEQLNGYWRNENSKGMFVKIDKKGAKNIEYAAMDTHEIWYTGNVQFDTVKQKALSGNMKYLAKHGEDNAESLPEEAFKLEVVSADKITVTKGNEVFNLRKSSTKEYEKEQSEVVGGTEETNTQPKQNTKLDGFYVNAQSDSKLYIDLEFTMTDDKNAKVAVEQRTNNSNGITTSLMGSFYTNAVKQNDSTWTFQWVDNNELGQTNGTGTITFQGENPTLDLKGERDKLSEGRGIVNQKVTLKKSE